MSTPKRIVYKHLQVKPPGVAIVTGVSKWANPHRVDDLGAAEATRRYRVDLHAGRLATRAGRRLTAERARRELRGKDLGCSCPLDQPCHADVLIEVANA